MCHSRFFLIAAAIFLLASGTRLSAQWSADPNVNNIICNAPNFEDELVSTSDGVGGAIFAWTDYRTFSPDSQYLVSHIYAQRISASGIIQWTTDGVALTTGVSSLEGTPIILSDGNGGAIISYGSLSLADYSQKLIAQRIDATGNLLWGSAGINAGPPDTIGFDTYEAVSDGAGGMIITWTEYINNGLNVTIYAQKIDATGNIQWTDGGVRVCTSLLDDDRPAITSDGLGGALISWTRYDNGLNPPAYTTIYAQHLNSSGMQMWSTFGVPICRANTIQESLSRIVSDGHYGAIIAWSDFRDDPDAHIYVQRINSAGTVKWTPNGNRITIGPTIGDIPEIVSDNAGGAILCWGIFSPGLSNILAQRIDSSGSTKWAAGGLRLASSDSIDAGNPILLSDGTGGAIVAWSDYRNTQHPPTQNFTHDIFAQKISPAGNNVWESSGIAICTAPAEQVPQSIVSHMSGGAIISWLDPRILQATHVYAQRIPGSGNLIPPPAPVLAWRTNGSTNQPTSLTLRWHASKSATKYELQVSADSTFQLSANNAGIPLIAFQLTDIPDTFRNISALAHDTTYYWRVRAFNDMGPSGWSAPWHFSTSPEGTLEFAVRKHWNLLSVPLQVSDNQKNTLYPLSTSDAFSYSQNTGYVASSSLQNGEGYWLRFNEDQFVPIIGTPFSTSEVALSEGWNMIGTISSTVNTSGLTTDPRDLLISPFWGYEGSYISTTLLQPGEGYWVKTNASGILHVTVSQSAAASSSMLVHSQNSVMESLAKYNTITVIDANGDRQTLYYASTSSRTISEGACELPPMPPRGSFDVRFASQRIVEMIDSRTSQRFPVIISTEHYPVTLRWNEQQPMSASLRVGEQEIALHGSGEMKIADQETPVVLVASGMQTLPNSFLLDQNYPNPFNPTTTISYMLPTKQSVRLSVFNLLGQEIRSLVYGEQEPGYKTVQFDASSLSSGIYFYKLTTSSFSDMKKMALIR